MDPAENNNGTGPETLLVNPWIYDFAAGHLLAKPLGLLYIAAVPRDKLPAIKGYVKSIKMSLS